MYVIILVARLLFVEILDMKTRQKITNAVPAPICIVCTHVLSLQRPILYVAHDDDNAWKFSCRQIGHKMTNLKIMALTEVTKLDATLNELFEMPPGVGSARNNPQSPWEPFLLNPDENFEE
jgi:hypothetical protein